MSEHDRQVDWCIHHPVCVHIVYLIAVSINGIDTLIRHQIPQLDFTVA
jgi:hypothetical protein